MMLKTSCNVTGTGFVVSEEILKEAGGWPWHLLCEDLHSVDQILAGRRIGYCPQAEFFDEQPTDYAASVKQRMRWCKGFLQVLGSRGGRMVSGRAAGQLGLRRHSALLYADPAVHRFEPVLCRPCGTGRRQLEPALVLGAVADRGGVCFAAGHGDPGPASPSGRICGPPPRKSWQAFVTFPLFMATYLPVGLVACFKKVEWAPIRHSAAVSIRQVAGTEKRPPEHNLKRTPPVQGPAAFFLHVGRH